MKTNKIIGGMFLAVGLLIGICVYLSYLDGYEGWWIFFLYSSVKLVGGMKIWRD